MNRMASTLVLALFAGAPQAPPAEAPKKDAAVSVGYVLVPVVVTDAKGRSIAGLRQRDFTVVVEDRPVMIDLFAASGDAPVSFTVLLDGSGSMALAGKMDGARAALEALVAQARPDDDFALFLFAEGAVREMVPFTSDGERLVRAARSIKPYGKTAFFDALARMPDQTLRGKNGSRAIVLLTDGIDNASVLTREQLTELLQGVDVPVYPIALRTAASGFGPGDPQEHDVDVNLLKRIAFETGGRLAVVEEPGMLAGAIREIGKDLRSQYLLGFTPTGTGPVKYRQISLMIAGRIGTYRTRSGYRGTEPPWIQTASPKKGKKT